MAVLLATRWDLKDPCVDLRPTEAAKAYAAVTRIRKSGPATMDEGRELFRVSIAGRVAEELLEIVSKQEGRTIFPDPAGAGADLDYAASIMQQHHLEFEEQSLWTETRDALADQLLALIEIAGALESRFGGVVRREDLEVLPRVAELIATVQKAHSGAVDEPIESGSPESELQPSGGATHTGIHRFIMWLRRLVGLA